MSDFVEDWLDISFNDLIQRPDAVEEGLLISDVVKEYHDMIQIVIYHDSYFLPAKKGFKKEQKNNRKLDVTHRSIQRSKVAIKDIIISNDWDFWCTFTFSPKKVDRYNFDMCARKMHLWLHRQKGLRYIVVPEHHKDGAIHFHALISDYKGILHFSRKRTKNGQRIFRGNFGSGFHEFVELDKNSDAIANYMIKQYITKSNPLLSGRKRYWCSQGLDRPVSYVNGLSRFKLWSLVKGSKPAYISDKYEIHHIKKQFSLDTDKQSSFPVL